MKEDGAPYELIKKALDEKYRIDENRFRFGWLDLNLIKHAHLLNRLSSLFITELDVLDDLEEIKICKKYKQGENIVDGYLPPLITDFGKMTPEY
jgi:adenylosuccinate synthase